MKVGTVTNLDCDDAGETAGAVSAAATAALEDFKNSYYSSSDAIIDGSSAELGQTAVTDDGTTVSIVSCVEKTTPSCSGDATMGNTIIIE